MMHDEKHEQDMNPQTAADINEAVTASDAQVTDEDDADEVRVALNQCRQELQQTKNDLLRAHADFDNFRKRMRAERDQEFSRGSDRVLSELLPVVDDFERAYEQSAQGEA
jgi:molecular chaperone GrpE